MNHKHSILSLCSHFMMPLLLHLITIKRLNPNTMEDKVIIHSIEEFDCVGDIPVNVSSQSSQLSIGSQTTHHSTEYDASSNEATLPPVAISTTTNKPSERGESSAQKWRRRRVILLYLITITILFSDMNLMAPNLST